MAATAILMKEIEKLSDEAAAEVLDFVLFIGTRKPVVEPKISKAKSMFGIFPGIRTDVEREDEDRV